MDRRSLLQLGALASAIPSLALAQTSATPVSLEAKHAAETLEAGALSLETSRAALEKAADANVKRFAQFEAAEQETVAAVVRSVAAIDDKAPKIEGDAKTTLDSLKNTKEGPAFDQAYIQVQLDGHRRLLEIQEGYLSAGKDKAHRAIASLARGHIKEHIAQLESLHKLPT